MTVSFYFQNPSFSDILSLSAFILYLMGVILLRKKEDVKFSMLLVIGSIITISWYIANFFIPRAILLANPNVQEVQFVKSYAYIIDELIPHLVLIFSIGILPIIVGINNRDNFGTLLALGGVIFIASLITVPGLNNLTIAIISLIILRISMTFFAFYGYKLKQALFIIFSGVIFSARFLIFNLF